MNWLRKWLGLCQHKWAIHEEIALWDYNRPQAKNPTGYLYMLRCEHCGNMKRVRASP